jgi:hypothetical protein
VALEDFRRFTKLQVGSRRLKKVQGGSRRLKMGQDGSRRPGKKAVCLSKL